MEEAKNNKQKHQKTNLIIQHNQAQRQQDPGSIFNNSSLPFRPTNSVAFQPQNVTKRLEHNNDHQSHAKRC